MNALVKPTEFADAPLWDLSDLYASREDGRISADLDRAKALVDQMNAFQGKLVGRRGDAAALGAVLDQTIARYEQAADVMGGLGAYSFLAASTARDDAGAQGFEANIREKMTVIATPTVWLTLEINQLDEAEIEAALIAHPAAGRWSPWLRRVRAMKPRHLSSSALSAATVFMTMAMVRALSAKAFVRPSAAEARLPPSASLRRFKASDRVRLSPSASARSAARVSSNRRGHWA